MFNLNVNLMNTFILVSNNIKLSSQIKRGKSRLSKNKVKHVDKSKNTQKHPNF